MIGNSATKLASILFWLAKTNIAVLVLNVVILVLFALLSNYDVNAVIENSYFSKILLLESGIVFLMGGLAYFSSSVLASKFREHVLHSKEEWSEDSNKKAQKRANLIVLLAILLFLESLVLSLFAL